MLDALDAAGVESMVMGGLVVPLYTLPYATHDVDLTLALPADRLEPLLDLLEERGISIPEPARAGQRNHLAKGIEVLKVTEYHPGYEVRIDLFPVSTRYQEEAFSRRRRGTIEGRSVWIVSPEDLLLHKAIANRPKDHGPIENLVVLQGISGALDLAYLARWARELGVRETIEPYFSRWGVDLPPG